MGAIIVAVLNSSVRGRLSEAKQPHANFLSYCEAVIASG
jgi:hypothetical protein